MNNKIPKKLLKELADYDFCLKVPIPPQEVSKVKDNPDKVVYKNTYICEADDYVNTRILFDIFKCINLMKNLVLTGLVCGIIGIVTMIVLK